MVYPSYDATLAKTTGRAIIIAANGEGNFFPYLNFDESDLALKS